VLSSSGELQLERFTEMEFPEEPKKVLEKKNQVPSSITGCKFTSQGRTDLSLLFLPASIFVGPETAAELGELIISMRFFLNEMF
jgi:hypothetical protein